MSPSAPDVSVVIDTETEEPNHWIGLRDTLDSWKKQTSRDRILEYLVVSPRPATAAETELLHGIPARWVERPGLRYYDMKNEGIRMSRGRYVTLVDSDARPAEDWLERALESLETCDPRVALVTGRTRYVVGPFSRELAVAQLPHQSDARSETHHFLAHNVLFRGDLLRARLFRGAHIRLGADTDLARRLLEDGYRLRYEPGLAVTHNYSGDWRDLWMHCEVVGYHDARYRAFANERVPGTLKNAVGRFRLLLRRLFELQDPTGIPRRRLPLSILFLAAYCAAVGRGFARGRRDGPEPFAQF
jgi:glycosyltransferase involved in cell wall biosynthesis